MTWRHFAHDADIGVCGSGPSLAAAFEEAAMALTAVIADPARVESRQAVGIVCAAPSAELLLVDWLNALIFEMAVRSMLFGRYEVKIDAGALTGTAWGEPLDRVRHAPAVEIKGATYTELFVGEDANGTWTARCIVDV